MSFVCFLIYVIVLYCSYERVLKKLNWCLQCFPPIDVYLPSRKLGRGAMMMSQPALRSMSACAHGRVGFAINRPGPAKDQAQIRTCHGPKAKHNRGLMKGRELNLVCIHIFLKRLILCHGSLAQY